MIGVKHWNDQSRYHVQTNNAWENNLSKMTGRHVLETCGPTAAANCMDAMGILPRIVMPGGWEPQAEDVLTLFMADPRNEEDFRKIRPSLDPHEYMGNRVPQYYEYAVREVFGVKANFTWDFGWTFDKTINMLKAGYAVQICMKVPGHYLAVVGYNEDVDMLVYNDSWPQRRGIKNGGFNEIMGRTEFGANVEPFAIWYEA